MEMLNGSRDAHKIVSDYDDLAKVIEGMRLLGLKIVATIGTWDLLHIGHVRYLRNAKSRGDVLVVGTDSDRAVRDYKGPLRPIVPYTERVEMLSYQGCVDLIVPVDDVDNKGRWKYGLVKKIKPDVFVAVEDSYSQAQVTAIKKYACEVVVLPRQAEGTSTSRMIEDAVKKHVSQMLEMVTSR